MMHMCWKVLMQTCSQLMPAYYVAWLVVGSCTISELFVGVVRNMHYLFFLIKDKMIFHNNLW